MISRNYKTEAIVETPHKVDVRQLYNKDSAQVMHITLQPGEALKPHKTPVDVFFYVLEGEPSIHIGDKTITFEKDSLIESPKDIVHYISNPGKTQARILVVKAPKPTTNTRLL
ncbi:MAG: cupin domain-containing protein [Bacteroidales bacterium]|jgi:mannose-6-phosphate isomerase-like protein (cupin superfamily)|nr:cupin domain-containing protein [Bacteroidales bacterium]MCK9499909.1 cupin domain-containing protein [Bacteroidales bacterium]MDY0313604.1 cupin domain-containing protein [Bacteroidales bacterium]NLB87158.1 cupin domain-containing protein [Bacteroidales bacterium]